MVMQQHYPNALKMFRCLECSESTMMGEQQLEKSPPETLSGLFGNFVPVELWSVH